MYPLKDTKCKSGDLLYSLDVEAENQIVAFIRECENNLLCVLTEEDDILFVDGRDLYLLDEPYTSIGELTKLGNTFTCEDWWDCKCLIDYIHNVGHSHCRYCKAQRDSADTPDSHAREVLVLQNEWYMEGAHND